MDLVSMASARIEALVIKELQDIALQVAQNALANGVYTPKDRQQVIDAVERDLRQYAKSVKKGFLEKTASMLNTAFTSDTSSRLGLVKWSKHAPVANEDEDRTFEGQTLRDLWTRASTQTSNLFAVVKVDRDIEDSQLVGPKGRLSSLEVAHALLKYTDLKTWGIDRHVVPRTTGVRELLTKEGLAQALKSLGPRASEKDLGPKTLKEIYNLPFAHLMYKFALGPSPQFHHALYVGNRVNIEVQNIIINGHVTSLVTPSTLLNFMLRARSNGIGGVYQTTYDTSFPVDAIRKRALWTIGKSSYNILFENCENLCSWVLSNNHSNVTCKNARAVLGLSPKRSQPTSFDNSVSVASPVASPVSRSVRSAPKTVLRAASRSARSSRSAISSPQRRTISRPRYTPLNFE